MRRCKETGDKKGRHAWEAYREKDGQAHARCLLCAMVLPLDSLSRTDRAFALWDGEKERTLDELERKA